MSLAEFVRNGRSAVTRPLPLIVVDVRSVGFNLYEAHDSEGYYSAVGHTREEAVTVLRDRLPQHEELRVWFPGAASSVVFPPSHG